MNETDERVPVTASTHRSCTYNVMSSRQSTYRYILAILMTVQMMPLMALMRKLIDAA
jgi:hypothetical protein